MAGISAADFNMREQMEILTKAIEKLNASILSTNQAVINNLDKSSDNRNAKELEGTKKRVSLEEKQTKVNEDFKTKKQKERDEETRKTIQDAYSILNGLSSSITGQFKQMLSQYSNSQQKLAFNLIGSGMSYDTVQAALKTLSTSTIIKQNEVYNKLTNLVSQGITVNVAQRAFLQQTAEQVGWNFDMTSSTLNRLIQIQNNDITEARIAQMAGLNKFLEQNYQNSQYIQQGFSKVSDALFEMQSMMSSSMAMATEKTIQTYLGSFASAGGSMSTIDKLANAINAVGSGNFEGLGDMQNLMIMAASRANLSYADLLTGGLNENQTEQLMNSLISYISSMQDMTGGSNVALSAIAKIFGVSVSDIKAAQGMDLSKVNTNYESSIADFLGNVAANTNMSVQLSNWFNNRSSNLALNSWLGMGGLGEVGFNIFSDLSSMIGSMIGSMETSSGIFDLFGGKNVTEAAKAIAAGTIGNAPGLAILAGALGPAIGNIFTSGNISSFLSGEQDFSSMLQGILTGAVGQNGVDASVIAFLRDYNNIKGYNNRETLSAQGSWSGLDVGESTSGTAVENGEEDTTKLDMSTIIEGYGTENEAKTLDDLYNLLVDDFPTTTFTTATRLVEAGNEVLIGDAKTTQYITDMLTITAVSAENILALLENVYAGGTRSLIDMGSLGLENTWGDWSGTSRP